MIYRDFLKAKFTFSKVSQRLPKEFQEVEYIQCDGGQHINLGVKGNQDTKFICDIEPDIITSTNQLVGDITSSSSAISSNLQKSTGYTRFGNKYKVAVFSEITIDRHIIIISNEGYFLDDVLIWTPQADDFITSNNIYILGANGSTSKFRGKCYSIQRYDNDILVNDFVPCYRRSDSVIGMYDLVSKSFYINNGSGEFIKGQDI